MTFGKRKFRMSSASPLILLDGFNYEPMEFFLTSLGSASKEEFILKHSSILNSVFHIGHLKKGKYDASFEFSGVTIEVGMIDVDNYVLTTPDGLGHAHGNDLDLIYLKDGTALLFICMDEVNVFHLKFLEAENNVFDTFVKESQAFENKLKSTV